MPDAWIRIIVGGLLLLHGLGHGGALGALIWLHFRPQDNTGAWTAARSWIVPLSPGAASALAMTVWSAALAGFVIAGLAFWSIGVPHDWWRGAAVASAVVSLAGILTFLGTWPAWNTLAALAVNVGVFVCLLWLHWPPESVIGGG